MLPLCDLLEWENIRLPTAARVTEVGGRRALRVKRVQVKCVGDAGGAHTQRMHLLRFHALPVVRRARIRVPQHLVRADNALDVRRRIVPCAGLVRMVLRSVIRTHHASKAQVRCADLGVARTRSDAEDSVRVVGRAHRRRRSGGHVEALGSTKRCAPHTCGSARGCAPRRCAPDPWRHARRRRSARASRECLCGHLTSHRLEGRRRLDRGTPRA